MNQSEMCYVLGEEFNKQQDTQDGGPTTDCNIKSTW